jgi:hypothetical protein
MIYLNTLLISNWTLLLLYVIPSVITLNAIESLMGNNMFVTLAEEFAIVARYANEPANLTIVLIIGNVGND